MGTEDQPEDTTPIIEVDLGKNGGRVSFKTVDELAAWIKHEVRQWDTFRSQIENLPISAAICSRQLELPNHIRELVQEKGSDGTIEPGTLARIKEYLTRYAKFQSVYSKSPLGEVLLALVQNGNRYLAAGGLAGALGIPADELLQIPAFRGVQEDVKTRFFAGYPIGQMRNFAKRSEIPDHLSKLERLETALQDLLSKAERETEEVRQRGEYVNADNEEKLSEKHKKWGEFTAQADSEWQALRHTFEQQLTLEAPSTYWRRRSKVSFLASMVSLVAFLILAGVGIGTLVYLGPGFLERLAKIEGLGPISTVVVVSVPALLALWGLRHIARLFIVNLERSADAKMRETMSTTFLALIKNTDANVSDKERLLVLEALFRAPAPAPTDDGHFGGALDILTRRS